ncbi:reductive dehalogenase [Chloroflexota bacterium]
MLGAPEQYRKRLVGPIRRFDQRNEMFRRARHESEWIERAQPFYSADPARDQPGYTRGYHALTEASWYLEDRFAMGQQGSNLEGLYAWAGPETTELLHAVEVDASTPTKVSQQVKKVARFFGASQVGICELDQRWLYSVVNNDITGEDSPLDFPDDHRYAIVMAVEMDYSFIQTSPTYGASAATGLGYSKMAFIAGLLAQFIRALGYKAIPCGNDTALSIPLAVEAGLGELGRNGLLITEKYGPRVRLCKVFTNMPLIPDKPYFFGVDAFCRECMICAQDCPSKAISFDKKTVEALNKSNNPGVLKWPVNAEQCFKYWIANRTDCANCIRVCPFNTEAGWHHDLVRSCIRNVPQINPLFVWLSGALGYGRQLGPETIWEG